MMCLALCKQGELAEVQLDLHHKCAVSVGNTTVVSYFPSRSHVTLQITFNRCNKLLLKVRLPITDYRSVINSQWLNAVFLGAVFFQAPEP